MISTERSGRIHHSLMNDKSDVCLQATEVEAAIKGLLNGTIAPENVKIEGIDTEEEKAEKEVIMVI